MGKGTKVKESTRKAALETTEAVVAGVDDSKKKSLIKSRGPMDEFGFGSDTHGSFILAHLEDGDNTKAQITELFCDHFRIDLSDGKATFDKTKGTRDDKRKKSSLSVFFSDVTKPFGTYHAARSLIIVEDKETHKLSLEPKRLALVKKAIAEGIIESLKGFTVKKHPEKIAAIRKKYGVPQE